MNNKTRKTLKNIALTSIIPITGLLSMNNANAQTQNINNPSNLHITFQPEDLAWGFRNDLRLPLSSKKGGAPSHFGIYTSMSKGNYRLDGNKYIRDHVKLGGGALFYFGDEPSKDLYGFVSLGGAYNYYGKKSSPLDEEKIGVLGIEDRRFKKTSADLGVGIGGKNLSGFVSLDLFNPSLIFGGGFTYSFMSKMLSKKDKKLLAKMYSETQ